MVLINCLKKDFGYSSYFILFLLPFHLFPVCSLISILYHYYEATSLGKKKLTFHPLWFQRKLNLHQLKTYVLVVSITLSWNKTIIISSQCLGLTINPCQNDIKIINYYYRQKKIKNYLILKISCTIIISHIWLIHGVLWFLIVVIIVVINIIALSSLPLLWIIVASIFGYLTCIFYSLVR